jgi:hypothetical protein
MSDNFSDMDEQWGELLSRSYGNVDADQAFKAGLLTKLKAKQAEVCAKAETEPDAAGITTEEESNWSALLTRTHPECEPRADFKAGLLANLKTRQAELALEAEEISAEEEANWSTLLTKSYGTCETRMEFKHELLGKLKASTAANADLAKTEIPLPVEELISTAYIPVEPSREFQTRLLLNLKERQQTTIKMKEDTRRRSIFSSFASGLAAAAAVAFVVWLAPAGRDSGLEMPVQSTSVAYQGSDAISSDSFKVNTTDNAGAQLIASASNDAVGNIQTASLTRNAASGYATYSVDAAFASPSLPKTVRGVGMQVNDGGGWRDLDEARVTRVSPGMAFRATRQTAGLGFSDGSTVLMWPEAVITASENGFAVDQGQLAVTVPAGTEQRFHINLPERDIAIEPGTMLAVNAFYPSRYAEGGAPAPEVKVLDGGLAVARGRNGAAPLLANQVYLIDNYITPDIPGRPLCSAESAELEGACEGPSGLTPYIVEPSRLVANTTLVSPTSSSAPSGFNKKNGKWVAASYTEDQPVVKIQYLSDDYFGLANSRRDLGQALAAGPEAIIDAGNGVFYEIHR